MKVVDQQDVRQEGMKVAYASQTSETLLKMAAEKDETDFRDGKSIPVPLKETNEPKPTPSTTEGPTEKDQSTLSSKQNVQYAENNVPEVVDALAEDQRPPTLNFDETPRFPLDYDDYVDESAYFSNNEVIPSHFDENEAAADPRYDHDEYVDEEEFMRAAASSRQSSSVNEGRAFGGEQPERRHRPEVDVSAVVGISVGAFLFILMGTSESLAFLQFLCAGGHFLIALQSPKCNQNDTSDNTSIFRIFHVLGFHFPRFKLFKGKKIV